MTDQLIGGRRKGKTKLVARDGKIAAESTSVLSSEDGIEVEAVTVSFRIGIQANGGITRITLRQGASDVRLTLEQGKSLAREILARVGP